MRTGKVTINGTEYPLCFSTRVLVTLEERGKSEGKSSDEVMAEIMGGADGGISVEKSFWLLAAMIDAGVRYKKLNGGCDVEAPSADDLIDTVDPEDYGSIFAEMAAAVTGGQERTVEAVPPKDRKNGDATPGK